MPTASRTPEEYVAKANERIKILWRTLKDDGKVQGRAPTIAEVADLCDKSNYNPADAMLTGRKSHHNGDKPENFWQDVFFRIGDIIRGKDYRKALTPEEIAAMSEEDKLDTVMRGWSYLFSVQSIGFPKYTEEHTSDHTARVAMSFCNVCESFDKDIAEPETLNDEDLKEDFKWLKERGKQNGVAFEILTDFDQFKESCKHCHERILENHRRGTDHLKHPVVPILVEWHKHQNRVTAADDVRTPAATFHQNSAGKLRHSWRTENSDDIPSLPQPEQPPESAQFFFSEMKPNNTIVPAGGLSFSVAPGITPIGRMGHVPVPFSIIEEGLFLLLPTITSGEYSIELGDLTERVFFHNNRVRDYNRDLVIASLAQCYNDIRLPYEDPSGGGSGTWRPVIPLNPPQPGAKDNYLVHMHVSVPHGHTGGYVIEKALSRQLRVSSIQSNLYRTGCAFFDKLGNVDSTIPVEPIRKDDDNPKKRYYIRKDGSPYLDRRGKPITDSFHPDIISQLERDDNPKAKYRNHLWDKEAIIRAGMVNYNPRRKTQHLSSVLTALHKFMTLVDAPPFHVEGVTQLGTTAPLLTMIDEKGKVPSNFIGIYVIPAKRHLNLRRAITQASKKK